MNPGKSATSKGITNANETAVKAAENEVDIFTAAQYGDFQRIEGLITSGAVTASEKNDQGITPLHWAAINDRLLACKTLLDAGAEVNAIGGDLEATPMHWAAKNGHVYTVHLLSLNGGDPLLLDSQGYNVLQLATHSSNIFLILYLLYLNVPVDSPDPQGHTPLMWAAYQGDSLSVDLLLRWGADVNKKDENGLTALHWAVVRGNQTAIKRIVEDGADISTKQDGGKTPRDLAKDLKNLAVYDAALLHAGRNADGLVSPRVLSKVLGLHVPNISLTAQSLATKTMFVLPIGLLYTTLQLSAVAPIFISLPISMILWYSVQQLINKLLVSSAGSSNGVQQTPYLAGIFFASALWTGVHWAISIAPNTYVQHPFLNGFFGLVFSFCTYNFVRSCHRDPGYIPKHGSRAEQRDMAEDLLRSGEFDARHFCTICLLRKPLRSKHCRICNRCIAKHDHHCPWIDNCVGIANHRNFMSYILALFAGIVLYLILSYLHVVAIGRASAPLECTLLAKDYCDWLQADAFGIILVIWDALQLTWVSMLLCVQLYQISRGVTTVEVLNIRRHGHPGGRDDPRRVPLADQLASAITTGSLDPESSGIDPDGQGPSPVTAHSHRHRGITKTLVKLLGVDQFVNTAKDGFRATKGQRKKKKSNPFDGGVIGNCNDFWTKRDTNNLGEGAGQIKGIAVDYYTLSDVPNAREMYSQVSTQTV